MSFFTGIDKSKDWKAHCPVCGTGTDHPSGYCEMCPPPQSTLKKWQGQQMVSGKKPPPPMTQCASCGQVYQGKHCTTCALYMKPQPRTVVLPNSGLRMVQPTDPFDYQVFNDLAYAIETLHKEVATLRTELENMNFQRCAECGERALPNDYLCQECRG